MLHWGHMLASVLRGDFRPRCSGACSNHDEAAAYDGPDGHAGRSPGQRCVARQGEPSKPHTTNPLIQEFLESCTPVIQHVIEPSLRNAG